MSGPADPARFGGSGLTLAAFGAVVAVFGLVVGLPYLLGPVVGLAGVVASWAWRRRRAGAGRELGVLPAIVALGVLALAAPAVPATELLGGLSALALLLWAADDPARPAGGGRRAVGEIATCGLAVAVAWTLVLTVPRRTGAIDLAGALLAALLLLVAWLLTREASRGTGADASA